MPINKTTFYPGETIVISGRITPMPASRHVQLAIWYYCPKDHEYVRTSDLWTLLDDYGNYNFSFTAYIISGDYCRVTTSQAFYAMVRYLPVAGGYVETWETLLWEVLNVQRIRTTLTIEPIYVARNCYDIYIKLVDEFNRPLSNKTIKIYVNDSLHGSILTDINGEAVYRLIINTPGTYSVYAEYESEGQYIGC